MQDHETVDDRDAATVTSDEMARRIRLALDVAEVHGAEAIAEWLRQALQAAEELMQSEPQRAN